MSQANNRVSYASIAGRKTSKPSFFSPQKKITKAEATVDNEEEYPPIGVQTGPTKPKKDGPLKQDKSEIVPNKIKELEEISTDKEKLESRKATETDNLPDLSQLSLEEFSKTDSPRSKTLSDSGVENHEPRTKGRTWAQLFKDEKDRNHVEAVGEGTPIYATSLEMDGPLPETEYTEEDGELPFNNEEDPICSRSLDLAPASLTEEFPIIFAPECEEYPIECTMQPMAYVPIAPPMNPPFGIPQFINPPYAFIAPQPIPMVQSPYFPGYMPPPMDPSMMPILPNMPGPSNAIAHPLHGMVYYQYENEVPPEAFQPVMYQPPAARPPVRPLMALQPMQYTNTNTSEVSTPSQKPSSRDGDGWNNAVESMRFEQKVAGKMDLIICNRYQTYLKINRGSCGTVFAAVDMHDPQRRTVAVKFEDYNETRSNLTYEHDVYKACSALEMNGIVCGKEADGFARIYWMGTQFKYRILIMQLLGPSLENLFSFAMKQFSPETIYILGNQMIDRIEHLHNAGFVHRDVKPDNFVMGLGSLENTVYMIDFGLSRKCKPNPDNKASSRKDKSLVGTAKYASINSHKGLQLSRRDDLESIAYILVEFINGELPWKPENWKNSSRDSLYKLMWESKKNTNWSVKCPEMAEWINYVVGLEFNDQPDYEYLRRLLTKYLENARSKPQRATPLSDHLAKVAHPESNKNSKKRSKGIPQKTVENLEEHKFEWIVRRESCPNDMYSYECLYRWTLPYGQEPQRPPGHNPSNVFGYGFGEGGFA